MIGFLILILVAAILVILIFSGQIECKIFVTNGPAVRDSFLCVPFTYLVVAPLVVVSEVFEDIFSGSFDIQNFFRFIVLLFSVAIYFSLFISAGIFYGRKRNR